MFSTLCKQHSSVSGVVKMCDGLWFREKVNMVSLETTDLQQMAGG